MTLASFRGKYVLVDFWAGWCGPTGAEESNVVKAYNRFKEKGFTILGVSFDERKDKWQQAIEQDDLTWTHVSDLKGWGNEVGKLYGIRAIPQNVLVDPEGKIIARNLRAEDLNHKAGRTASQPTNVFTHNKAGLLKRPAFFHVPKNIVWKYYELFVDLQNDRHPQL